MWIVQLALKQPHTFIVMAISILMFGAISIARMPIDIFPTIDIPIVSCIWSYAGMSPYDMENLVCTITERALTSTMNGIERMESTSLSGMSIIKVYLQHGTPVGENVAMVASVGAAILKQLPRGISPPFVTASSATDVPVIQLGISSDKLNEAELFDIANNFVRTQLATLQGTTTPFPYGGKFRQVMIDLDPDSLNSYGLSADAVITAINNQSVIAPDGTIKMGNNEYVAVLNNMPKAIDELNDVPVKTVKDAVVFVRDVAQVHDGFQPQLNIVNENGKRAILFNILKSGSSSTLAVVDRIKAALPHIKAIVPPACKIQILTDQSIFVKDCVSEVVKEAITAASLTALMMLALLGSWRSTLIVATSIPLAILASIICLNVSGQTINSMTLGGLALAVGMLVDDATVEIENLHRNLDMGKGIVTAILDGAQQVALPALVSTLSICIVFVPLLFLTEPSRSLFVPLGMAVIFAMLASYGLSRTIVPLMSKALLAAEVHKEKPETEKPPGFFMSIHKFIDGNFEKARDYYSSVLARALEHPKLTASGFMLFYFLSLFLLPAIGKDYFPTIDAGQLRLHLSAHAGMRVEETEKIFKRVEASIKTLFPASELISVMDNIGLPVSPINFAYSDSQTISEADGEILISLADDRKHPTTWYQKQIRKMLRDKYPDCTYYFQPADIVTQILNAGLPAPIDIKVLGMKKDLNYAIAQKLRQEIKSVPGAVDVVLHQVVDAPHFLWTVDRTMAQQTGVTQNDVSNSLLISLSSSWQTKPNFWVNSNNGVAYNIAAQTPQHRISKLDDLRTLAITPSQTSQTFPQPQMLTNLASYKRAPTPAVVNHLNVQPVFDIFASCQDRDLGGVAKDIQKILERWEPERPQPPPPGLMGTIVTMQKTVASWTEDQSKIVKTKLPRGTLLIMGGQVKSMRLAFIALIGGLFFALLLVYLLLVVNFQSWSDPLIILLAIPGAFSGILWSLFATQTTFSIPALMGTIMCVGVASANSILMVTFANEERAEGKNAHDAAYNAGAQRFRPVIMTATAMIIGMIPMALGGGAGGSQNAPIGRAVIGGLTVATFSTLVFVPIMFSIIRGKQPKPARAGLMDFIRGRRRD